jgi:hypothetical protein
MDYSFGLACFIDILGTKERTNEKYFDKLFLKSIETFHRKLRELEKDSGFKQKMVASFSDCSYIIYKIDDNNVINQNLYLLTCLKIISKCIQTFPMNGFLVRGGISYGNVYFDNENNIFFGPAINDSYKLESIGKMPRLIIENELSRRLIEYFNKSNDPRIDDLKELIFQDEVDNRYYLNYLYNRINVPSQFDIFYNAGKMLSEKNIKEQIIKQDINHEIIAKHNWNLKYLNKVKSIIEKYKSDGFYEQGCLKYPSEFEGDKNDTQ